MNKKRVVVTGMGVVAPNAIGLADFETAIRTGRSGIRFFQEMQDLKFGCQVGGLPEVTEALKRQYFSELMVARLQADGIIYGCIAGTDAWKDASLPMIAGEDGEPDWEAGCIFGTGMASADIFRSSIKLVESGQVKRLGSTTVQQTMSSGVSAHLGGLLGLGNQVTTNASACSTGSEAVLMAFDRIQAGKAKRMLCGGCDSASTYVWAGFDAMRVLSRKSNEAPEKASRPMSATAAGFVPGGGAGALVLEELDTALERGARIYAEVLGGSINSGGQRKGGTMTAPNIVGVQRCIQEAVNDAGIHPHQIDAISGHLTATLFDPHEIENWTIALHRKGRDFPFISSLKSMIGHCLSAAGAIESVAAVLQLHKGFLHPSINSEDLHPAIAALIAPDCVPQVMLEKPVEIVAKSSFGFGDVNSCVIFKKFA